MFRGQPRPHHATGLKGGDTIRDVADLGGRAGAASFEGSLTALALLLGLPLKAMLFFVVLSRFRMRARSSLLASRVLANYSEFGLICGAVAVENGWLDEQWLLIIARAVALSFVLGPPVNGIALPGDADIVISGWARSTPAPTTMSARRWARGCSLQDLGIGRRPVGGPAP